MYVCGVKILCVCVMFFSPVFQPGSLCFFAPMVAAVGSPRTGPRLSSNLRAGWLRATSYSFCDFNERPCDDCAGSVSPSTTQHSGSPVTYIYIWFSDLYRSMCPICWHNTPQEFAGNG